MKSDAALTLNLFAALFGRIREDLFALAAGDPTFNGLRPSHFRLLDLVPEDGARQSDLVDPAGMTKQALGQFFAFLRDRGFVAIEPDPDDRRARIVRLTPEGERANAAALAVIAERERQWAEQVGPRRYQTFRTVLTTIADDAPVL